MDHGQQYGHDLPNMQNGMYMYPQPPPYDHSHHSSPVNEYNGYGWASPQTPIDPPYYPPPPPAPSQSHPQPRATHHQLQPLISTQWPSLLASQSNYALPPQHSSPQPIQPASSVSAPANLSPDQRIPPRHSSSATNPRRTLTDNDRREMCRYHERNPSKKQTEIGDIFGVERSTVSKVLRHKDKYLQQEADGSRSPLKKPKGKHPDIDRTLGKWVSNQQSKGVQVTDDLIRNQARFFWMAGGNGSECPIKIDSPGWLEKFKQKNNLHPLKTRVKSPLLGQGTSLTASPSSATTANDMPVSRGEHALSRNASPVIGSAHPSELHSARSHDTFSSIDSEVNNDSSLGLGIQNPGSTTSRVPFHSQSNNSLSSAFNTSASTGNTTSSSPSTTTPSFFPIAPHPSSVSQTHHPPLRPRRQTYPLISTEASVGATTANMSEEPMYDADTYISPPPTAPPGPAPRLTSTRSPVHTSMPPPSMATSYPPLAPAPPNHRRASAYPPQPTLITTTLPPANPSSTLVTPPPTSAPALLASPLEMDDGGAAHMKEIRHSHPHASPISPDDPSSRAGRKKRPSAEEAQRGLEVAMKWLRRRPSWERELEGTRGVLERLKGVGMSGEGIGGLGRIEEC